MLFRIKLIRLQKGFKAYEVAKQIGISRSYLSKLECGAVPITQDILLNLSKVYGINPTELV